MNRFRMMAIAGVAVLALLIGAVGLSLVGTALAADPTPTPSAGWQRGPMMPGSGPMGGMHGVGGPGMMGRHGDFGSGWMMDTLAEKLGMTAQEIQAERQAGKSLAEIAASKGISEDVLVSTMLQAHKAMLDERVSSGTITREQADTAYQWMEARVKEHIAQTGIGPNAPNGTPGYGMGFGRGHADGCGGPAAGMGPGAARWGASSF